jgi:hypothetical protein
MKHLQHMTLFIRIIIRTFQLVFSAETVFFSHNKSVNSVFSQLISTAERGLCLKHFAQHLETHLKANSHYKHMQYPDETLATDV